MIQLSAIRTAVKAAIEANAYFNNEAVIIDSGTSESAIESALDGRGFVVFIPPIIGANQKAMGKDNTISDADVMVCLQINPVANAKVSTGAQKEVMEAVQKIVAAVLAYDLGEKVPACRFRLDDDWLNISVFDDGLIAFDIFFKKQFAIYQ